MNPLLAWRPWAVALAAAAMFLTNLGGSHLWDEDEAKNARCGVEMHQRDEWVVPTYNDELRTHKPVLLYWAMRASYATWGVNEFAARLPSALSGVAIVVMCYHLARLLFDRRIGVLAALLLASSLMFATLARAATPDGVLMVSITAALLCFVAGVARRRGGAFSGVDEAGRVTPLASMQLPPVYAIGMYLSMGVAVLAKGPIGVLLPLWAIALYGLFGEPVEFDATPASPWRRWWNWFSASIAPSRWLTGARSIRMASGLVIVAGIAAPWYLAVSLSTSGDWLTGFLGVHNVGRFVNSMEGHGGPPFYYLMAVMAGFFPGSCFLPVAIGGGVARRAGHRFRAYSHAFCLAVIGGWIGFFSLAATKLPNYVIPCYVGLAVLTAAWLIEQARRFESAKATATVRSWIGAGMLSSAVVGVVLIVALAVVGGVLMGGSPWMGLVGIAPLAGGLLGLYWLANDSPRKAVGGFAAGAFVFTLIAMTVVGPVASPYADGPRMAEQVLQLEEGSGRSYDVATHRYTTPSLVWELDRHVPGLDAEATREKLADPAALVVMSKEAYDELEPTLPTGVGVLAEEGRFLRRERRVVMVGHQSLLAKRPTATERR